MGSSKEASVAPARPLALPNLTMPETVNRWGGPWNRILTVSPTWKSYLSAVPLSMTTWSGPTGALPFSQGEAGYLRDGAVAGADRRGLRRDGLAVLVDELGEPGDAALGGRHVGQILDRSQDGLRHRVERLVAHLVLDRDWAGAPGR